MLSNADNELPKRGSDYLRFPKLSGANAIRYPKRMALRFLDFLLVLRLPPLKVPFHEEAFDSHGILIASIFIDEFITRETENYFKVVGTAGFWPTNISNNELGMEFVNDAVLLLKCFRGMKSRKNQPDSEHNRAQLQNDRIFSHYF